ncbi:MAG: type II toxin-antitoxin system RelE/ParE family toxin [Chitinophagales bacterium]|nr:type II toxin-antitoxin system RelE/ParE family toxin [Chitinophagales bacterium]
MDERINFRIVILARAKQELIEAWKWYKERELGLGDRLFDEIEYTFSLIENNPEAFPQKRKSYREVRTKIFPYSLIYRISKGTKEVIITSAFHFKRNPKLKYLK